MERTISISMGKGSLTHNNRIFLAKNVDRKRIADNVVYKREDIRQVYHTLFDEALEEYNHRQKRKDRRIPDYYEKIRQSRQEKLFYEMIVQIGNKDDMGTDYREMAVLSKEILSFCIVIKQLFCYGHRILFVHTLPSYTNKTKMAPLLLCGIIFRHHYLHVSGEWDLLSEYQLGAGYRLCDRKIRYNRWRIYHGKPER